jgi:hypothetical protein
MAVTLWDILQIDFEYSTSYTVPASNLEISWATSGDYYTLANGVRMVPDVQSKMPAGVTFAGTLPVYVAVDRSTLSSQVLRRLTSVPLDLLILAVIWLFRQVALTAIGTPESPANPFIWQNVRRLRVVAALVAAVPLIDFYSSIAEVELVSKTLQAFTLLSWEFPDSFLVSSGLALMLAVLAEVFASGIRLREDVEGLV